jgi:hypothetical protein
MRRLGTTLSFVLPLALGLVFSKYGLHLDGLGTNFTW